MALVADYQNLSLNDIPATRRLSLEAANSEFGVHVAAKGAAAHAYDELISEGYIDELDAIHPAFRLFRISELGKLIYFAPSVAAMAPITGPVPNLP